LILAKVLVTGGNGFLAGWTIASLLNKGHTVRSTLRDLGKEKQVRSNIGIEAKGTSALEFVQADLMQDAGWAAAVTGCEYVLHIAAPVGVHSPRDPNELIVPTRDGALRVLSAACQAGVRRVVMTSAVEACRPPMSSEDCVTNESRWTDIKDRQIGSYRLAKTLAERAAWELMSSQNGETTFTTILPGAVIGPVFNADYVGSVQLPVRIMNGKMPRYPNLGFCVADVRDVADLHVRAMLSPDAAGQRFIAASDWMWLADITALLGSRFPDYAERMPTRPMSNWVLRLVALFNGDMRFVAPLIARKHVFTAEKARSTLDWEPRPAAETVVDAAHSAIAIGALK
jgi:nucleoside-diphosphate-sugar epimerase